MATMNDTNTIGKQNGTSQFETIKPVGLYYRGVFQRRLFSVDDAAVDIHNRLIDLKTAFRRGEISEDAYHNQLSALEEAGAYFNGRIADDYFDDEGVERDDEGRIISMDGESIDRLDIERINEDVKRFKKLLAREKDAEFDDLSYKELYESGIFRYKYFSVDRADIDVRNRLIDLHVKGAEEECSELFYWQEKARLDEAKKYLDAEMVNLHFLTSDCKKDPSGKYLEVRGCTVKPIDIEEIRNEFIAVRDAQVAAAEKQGPATGTTNA